MKINLINPSEPNAIYFYQSSLKDIALEGTQKDNNLSFFFKENDNIREKFYLKRLANNNFEGDWYNAKGSQFPVKLHPVDFNNYKAKLSEDCSSDKLNYVKSKFLEFKKQKTTIFNNKEFIWYSEKHCDATFFRLGENFSDKNKASVNPILEEIHITNTLSQLNCSSSFNYNSGKNIEYYTDLTFLNANLFGFKTAIAWDCGGAHPDSGTTGYLIDLNSGQNYEIDEILAFDKSVTTEKESGYDKYWKYVDQFYAPKLYALINSEQHFEKTKDTDCDMTNLDFWAFASWVYTEKGIEFTPSFEHVDKPCEEAYLVSFEKLRKYKNPKFKHNL